MYQRYRMSVESMRKGMNTERDRNKEESNKGLSRSVYYLTFIFLKSSMELKIFNQLSIFKRKKEKEPLG